MTHKKVSYALRMQRFLASLLFRVSGASAMADFWGMLQTQIGSDLGKRIAEFENARHALIAQIHTELQRIPKDRK